MATEHQPTGGQFLRTGVQAGAIALVIRMIFALTLEQMSFGSALAIGLLYFAGTALATMVIMLVIVRVRANRTR